MLFPIASLAPSLRWPAALTLAALLAAGPARANDCWLRCEGATPCTVSRASASSQDVPITFTTPDSSCAELRRVEKGERVEGMLRSRGKVALFSVARDQDVGAAVRLLGAGDCAFNSRACRERRDQAMLAGRGGKAFDGASGHAPAGAPCAIGLPCGLVLAPTQPWSLRIDDPRAADATLQVAALRNASGTIDVAVRDRRAAIAPGFVRAGASYSYALTARGGAVIAAGQFSAAAAAIENDVRDTEQAALKAGRSAAAARLEALLLSELDWDVMMLTRP